MVPEDYKVELEIFEGPLDLLLHLVKKHELDIFDIPVAFVTQKYLEYLELMRQLNLEVAGEYLLMASTLAHIKSRELLPSPEPAPIDPETGEEELDPRQELIKRLLEYQKYREAANELGERPVVGRNVWTRGLPRELATAGLEPDRDAAGAGAGTGEAPLAELPVFRLIEVLSDLMKTARVKLTHDVMVERLSITDRINHLVDRLDAETTFTFRSCFAFVESGEEISAEQLKHEVVVTFLAILEMAKLKLIRVLQPEGNAEIYIARSCENVRERANAQVGAAGGRDEEYR